MHESVLQVRKRDLQPGEPAGPTEEEKRGETEEKQNS